MQTSRTPVPGAPRQISSTVNQSPLRSFSDVLRTTVPPSEGIRPPSALPKPSAPSPVMSPIASVLSKTPAPSIAALSGLAKAAGSIARATPGSLALGSLLKADDKKSITQPGPYNPMGARRSQQDPYLGGDKVIPSWDKQTNKPQTPEKPAGVGDNPAARFANRSPFPLDPTGPKTRQAPGVEPEIRTVKTKPNNLPIKNDSPTVQDAIEGGSKGSTESPSAIPPVDYSKAPRPPAPSAPVPDRTGSTPAPASTASTPPAATPDPAPAAQQQKPVERPAPGPQRTPAAEVNTPPQKTFKDIRKPAEKPAEDKASGPSWVNDLPGRGGALQNRSRVFGADAGA